jgi:hypothetical protein
MSQPRDSKFVNLVLPKPELEYSTNLMVEIKIIRTEIQNAIQKGIDEITHAIVGTQLTEVDLQTILKIFRSNGYMAGAYGRVLVFHWGDAAQKIKDQLNPK